MPRKKIKYETKTNHNKRGNMSAADKEYVLANVGIKSDEEMAEHLKRTVDKIRDVRVRLVVGNKSLQGKEEVGIRIREELHNEPEWQMIKKSMSPEELSVFEYNYIDLLKQFKGDVLATERKQIMLCLNTQIKLLRHNLAAKRAETELERMQIMLERELDKPVKVARGSEETPRDETMIQTLSAQINGAVSASKVRASEYKDLSDKFSSTLKELKGTRDQRIQKVEDNKETFIGLLRKFEEDDLRKSVAIEQFIMGKGVEAEKTRLGELHTYMDGRVDRPILDSESI